MRQLLLTACASLVAASCTGNLPPPMVNLCASDWPGRDASRLYLVMFYSPRCGHCERLKPLLLHLARTSNDIFGLPNRPLTVAGVDCPEESNHQLCKRYNVTGYPTIFAIGQGHEARYKAGASDAELRRFLRTTVGSGASRRARCGAGVFKEPVVNLCKAHFPEAEAKHPWLVILYASRAKSLKRLQTPLAAAAEDLGGGATRISRPERLAALAEKYKLRVRHGGQLSGSKPFAKVGAMCCDCDQEARDFCKSLAPGSLLPVLLWSSGGKVEVSSRSPFVAGNLVHVALAHLGLSAGPQSSESAKSKSAKRGKRSARGEGHDEL
ncbi:unnamed protein product [Durusdinium trenchii]|uniref:Thioredoxin domain-containing protein n=1 Tax=Durusdinium trenchii TaxID=1381693 RepID=A0ABP0QV57_9DINO